MQSLETDEWQIHVTHLFDDTQSHRRQRRSIDPHFPISDSHHIGNGQYGAQY
jgi:hypothetical protein